MLGAPRFGAPGTTRDSDLPWLILELVIFVTVFATVGFGDIVAQTNGMKLLVTLQMLLNLAVLGLAIRLLTSAAQRGVQRRNELRGDPDGTGPPSGAVQPSQ